MDKTKVTCQSNQNIVAKTTLTRITPPVKRPTGRDGQIKSDFNVWALGEVGGNPARPMPLYIAAKFSSKTIATNSKHESPVYDYQLEDFQVFDQESPGNDKKLLKNFYNYFNKKKTTAIF